MLKILFQIGKEEQLEVKRKRKRGALLVNDFDHSFCRVAPRKVVVAASRKSNISNQKLYYKVCDKFSFLKINSLLYSVIIRFRSNMCH